MRDWVGAAVGVTAGFAFLAVLAVPYALQPTHGVTNYYWSGLVNPLFAGAFTLGLVLVFVTVQLNLVSQQVGGGIALGLAAGAFLVAVGWAMTARVDVFRAPGWVLPSHRFVLAGISGFLVVGAGWYAWAAGLRQAR